MEKDRSLRSHHSLRDSEVKDEISVFRLDFLTTSRRR